MKHLSIIKISNDHINVWRDGSVIDTSPQVAVLTADDVFVSHEVNVKAASASRKISHDYWSCLSENPLNYVVPGVRHRADLVYKHLENISERVGDLSDVIYAVPSNFSTYQLSLLLGINNALNLSVKGFVDANVGALASAATSGAYSVVDIQLSQTVIADIDVTDKVTAINSTIIPHIGRKNIFHACARYIANQFVYQTRFDPLHNSATEQHLLENLPKWVDELSFNKELSCGLNNHGESVQAVVSSSELKAIVTQNLNTLSKFVTPKRTLAFRKDSKIFANATSLFPEHQNIPDDATTDGIKENFTLIAAGNNKEFITQLNASSQPSMRLTINHLVGATDSESATHITDGKQALRLSEKSISFDKNGFLSTPSTYPSVTAYIKNGSATVRSNKIKLSVNGMTVVDNCLLKGGDEIRIRDRTEPFVAITVINNDTP